MPFQKTGCLSPSSLFALTDEATSTPHAAVPPGPSARIQGGRARAPPRSFSPKGQEALESTKT